MLGVNGEEASPVFDWFSPLFKIIFWHILTTYNNNRARNYVFRHLHQCFGQTLLLLPSIVSFIPT